MSQIEAVVNYDDLDLEELLTIDGLGEGITAAIESVHIVYQGILTTPTERYVEPAIQDALKRRLETISIGTGVSLESLTPSMEQLNGLVVSQEAGFMDAIQTIIQTILNWLGDVKRFFTNLWSKVFNRKTTVVAATKATQVKLTATVKQYETKKKEMPTTVKCTVPGRCYVLFHAKPHLPKAGFVYNQVGLDKAVDSVSKEIDRMIDAMSSETDSTLRAVQLLLSSLGRPMGATLGTGGSYRIQDEPLKDLKTNRKMYGLYHDRFEVIGMGIITKPIRHATRYHSEKFALTDTTRTHGWGVVDSFDITLDVDKIKELNDSVAKNANDKLTAIALLVDRVIKSREITALKEKLSDQRLVSALFSATPETSATTSASSARANLDRLELMTEYVNQLTDNLSLLYSFYARYIEILSVVTQRAVTELQNNS